MADEDYTWTNGFLKPEPLGDDVRSDVTVEADIPVEIAALEFARVTT